MFPEHDPEEDASYKANSRSGSKYNGRSYDADEGEDKLNDIPRSLKIWNIAAAIFQLLQAGALAYLAYDATTDWYLYTNYPVNIDERNQDTDVSGQDTFGRPDPIEIAAYSVSWYSAVFMLLSGMDHLLVSLPYFHGVYEYYIKRNQSPFRWAEYSLSASLMRVMIAQLCGVTDIHLLACIFGLTAITMLLGYVHESFNAKKRAAGYRQNWAAIRVSWLAHLASWAIIFSYFLISIFTADPPIFVYVIVFALFGLDLAFAVLFWLQWALIGTFRNYVSGEIGFIFLSFTAKSALAWINYGGSLR